MLIQPASPSLRPLKEQTPDVHKSDIQSSNHALAATIGKSAFFGVLSNAAQILTRLLTVPLVIHYLGLDGYGIWSIIMVTAAYMRFGTAGVKSAFQKYVAEATANGQFRTASRLLSTGGLCLLVISVAGLIPFAFFSKKLATMAGVPQHFLSPAAASIAVLAAIYAITNFGAVYEAIVMGGHRVDLTRKLNTVFTFLEAVSIILVLRLGYGLLAMTVIMGISELAYIVCCFRASQRIVPEIEIRLKHTTRKVLPELIRFAGSYQLVNLMEILQYAIMPIVVLKAFGATTAGVFAVAGRVITAAMVAQESLVLPILSGGTLVFTTGSRERITLFLEKSFKATLGSVLPSLAFVIAFGTTMVLAWTGERNSLFRATIWFCAVIAMFKAFSLLQLILYRASGRAFLDNLRQALRLAAVVIIGLFSRQLGYLGTLVGLATVEMFAFTFMFFAMSQTFYRCRTRVVIQDAFRIAAATTMIVVAGAMTSFIPIPAMSGDRANAAVKLAEIAIGCLIMIWPAATLTGALSASEKQIVANAVRRNKQPARTSFDEGSLA